MTIRTAPAPPPVRRTRSSTHQAAWGLIRIHRTTAPWFLGIVVTLLVGAVGVMVQVTDDELSIVQFGRHAFTWYPFSMGVIGVAACLGPHVAVGRTRRGFGRGAVLAGLVAGVFWALVLGGLFLLERVVFDLAGWGHRVFEAGWYTFEDGDLAGMFLGHLLLIVTGQMSALLVALGYARLGGGWGTLVLPLTGAPVLAALALLANVGGWVSAPVAIVGCLVAMTVAAVAFMVLVRGYTLDPA